MSKIIVGKPVKSGKAFRLAAILLSSTAVLSLGLTGAANADQAWTGATSTDWFTATNWNGNAVPTSADLATLDTIATNPTIIDGNDAVAGNVTIGNAGTGALTIQNAGTLSTGLVTVAGLDGSFGTVVIDGAGSQLTTTSEARVGYAGTGSLTVQNGATADIGGNLYLGDSNDADGTFIVTGAGSSAHLTLGAQVGFFGSGHYSVLDGATVTEAGLNIGDDTGSSGIVLVDGTGSSLTNTGTVFMGDNPGATSTLTISNGGAFSDTITHIGNGAGGAATVTVTDAGSTFTGSNTLFVGDAGTGTLNIENGGAVTAPNVTVGNVTGSSGSITIDASDMNVTNFVTVGLNGSGNAMVQDGGTLESNVMILGENTGSFGNITITGAGSNLTLTDGISVAQNGTGAFSLLGGATANIDVFDIADDGNGNGTAVVDGTGTLLTSTHELSIGNASGAVGTLTVSGAGAVENGQTIIGNEAGATGTIIVTDSNSIFTSNDPLIIGNAGNGTLNIESGGTVSAVDETIVGKQVGGVGTVLVDGAGSSLNATQAIIVGGDGVDPTGGNGTVTVSNGGAIEAQDNFIVGEAGGARGTVTVTDAVSQVTIQSDLFVGEFGTGMLTIENGGAIDVAFGASIGNQAGSTGTVTVAGTGSELFVSTDLLVGVTGTGVLSVNQGGEVDAANLRVAEFDGSNGTVTVNGSTALLDITNTSTIGGDSVGAMTVESGGTFETDNLTIGEGPSSRGNVTVTGSGSGVVVDTQATIGDFGNGNLSVLADGSVSDFSAKMGEEVGSTGTALVDGANSAWATRTELDVGFQGNGTITVSGGGELDAGTAFVAGLAGSVGSVTVTGTHSTWNSGGIAIGYLGVGTALIENGGTVVDDTTIIGYQPGGTANGTLTVDGVGSTWTGSQALYVGFAGNATLNVTDGGVFTSQTGFIGDQMGSVGTAVVDGAGSQWNTLGTLTVGGDASVTGVGDGTLTVRNGGVVSAELLSIADYAGSTGNVTVSGAGSKLTSNLAINVGSAATGTLSVLDGGVAQAATSFNVGLGAGSAGTATVDGAGSAITATGFAIVGYGGTGTLHIQNGGTVNDASGFLGNAAGSSGMATVDGAASQWKNTNNLYVASGGTGVLTISNGATVSAGLQTVIGHDAGSNGTINIGAANGSAAAAPGTLDTPTLAFGQGGGTLNFNHTSTNYTFAAAISGGGRLNQIAGSTFLNGNSSSFSGPTNILGGALHVNGSLKNSAVTVHSGGTLNGNGTVGNVAVQSGGILAPGNSIGTLNINGNYAAASGSIYQVQYGSGGADRLNVSGTATIASGAILDLVPLDAGFIPGTYTLLSAANGITGTFTVEGIPPSSLFHSDAVSYDTNDILLSVTKSKTFASVGVTPNEVATGGGADTLPVTNAVSVALSNLQTVAAANDAFDQLSGEIHASIKTAALEDSRFVRDAAMDHSRFDSTGADASVSAATFWTEGFGAWGSVSNDGNAAALHRSTGGIFAGVNLPVPSYLRLGVLGGYSRTTGNVKDRSSSASSDDYHVAIYGGAQSGNLDASIGGAYTWHDITARRAVAFTGYQDRLSSAYDAGTAQVFGEIGYHVAYDDIAIEPIADLAYVNLATAGFTETGGTAALTGRSDTTDATFSTLGARASTSFDAGGSVFTARGLLGWRHAFGSVVPLSTLAFAGSQDFTIAGVPIARDALTANLGVDAAIAEGMTLGVSYTGQIASDSKSNGVTANVSWQF